MRHISMNLSITEHFSVLKDPRQQSKVEHELTDILILCITAVICGAEGWQAIESFGHSRLEWLKQFGNFENGIPVDDTIARVISSLNPKELQRCFIDWMQDASGASQGKIISVDGKTVRRSFDKRNKKSAIHMVSAFASENGVVLGQQKTKDKSNEITAIPELLQLLELKGCIVTIDAMGCQKKIAKKILDKKADYVLAVKDNQKHLHNDIKDFFKICREENFKNVSLNYFEETHKGHGRVEVRRYWITDCLTCIDKKDDWPGLKSIGIAESERHINGKISLERRYFIVSLKPNAKTFANAVRSHWAIENKLHWVLDVTFREDESRVRRDNAAENFSVFRHISLNALRQEKSYKKGIKAKRFKAALEPSYAEKVIQDVF